MGILLFQNFTKIMITHLAGYFSQKSLDIMAFIVSSGPKKIPEKYLNFEKNTWKIPEIAKTAIFAKITVQFFRKQ